MRKILLIISTVFTISAFAGPGDTILVNSLDNAQMTWWGADDDWGVFPDTSYEFEKIYMDVTLGCATGGCSDWDYTVKIEGFHQTGLIDSALSPFPNYTVDGNAIADTFYYSNDTTYTTSWNVISNEVDSTAGSLKTVFIYGDTINYLVPTDTLYVWEANYTNDTYDGSGNVTGTFNVPYDSFLVTTNIYRYKKFDVIDKYELGRFMTPYGGYMARGQFGFNNDWTYTHTYDVTDYALMFHDSVKIRAFYGGWSSGFSATVNFRMVEGTPVRKVIKMQNLYQSGPGGWNSASKDDFEDNYTHALTIPIESTTKEAMVRVVPSGHGFVNDQNCAEFCNRDYYLKVDGGIEFVQAMWRNDCADNPIQPQAGTWQYNRANWCPGLKTISYDHEITDFITAGEDIEIDLDLEIVSMVVPSGEVPPNYIIEAQLFEYEESRDTTASIKEKMAAFNKSIKIAPNPSNGIFSIKFDTPGLIVNNITVYNLLGESIYQNSNVNSTQEQTINLSHLSEGTYFATIKTNKGISAKKIVITK